MTLILNMNRELSTSTDSILIRGPGETLVVKKLKIRSVEFLWDLTNPLPNVRIMDKAAVRAAGPNDIVSLRRIVVEAYLPDWSWWVGQIGGRERARADLMSYLSEFIRSRRKRIFVARENGEITGFCGAAKYNKRTGTIGYGVAVLPAYRGRGIGSMLLFTALAWLKKSGVRYVTLEEETFGFENKDTSAVRLYRRFGGQVIRDQPVPIHG